MMHMMQITQLFYFFQMQIDLFTLHIIDLFYNSMNKNIKNKSY